VTRVDLADRHTRLVGCVTEAAARFLGSQPASSVEVENRNGGAEIFGGDEVLLSHDGLL